MKILRPHDFIDVTHASLKEERRDLECKDPPLMWMKTAQITRLVDVSDPMHFNVLWTQKGSFELEDVWMELSMLLLQHDIVCEPLHTIASLNYPDLNTSAYAC